MKSQPLVLWGTALLLVAIGFEVIVGKDPPQVGGKGVTSATEKGATKSVAATPADRGDQKASAGPTEKQRANPTVSADEKAIRLTGDTFVKAYALNDAKATAAHFTADAEYIDEQGQVYQGREAIEDAMSALFTDNPGCQIELDIESIKLVSPNVAIEDGSTSFTSSTVTEPIESRYSAVHVKANGKWLAASVREHAPKGRRQHRSQLKQLAWLQGNWVDEGDDSVVIFSCDAVDGGHFLVRKFAIRIAGQEAMSGTQRIGWDPLTGKLRSWIFDSEGGYSEGSWHRDDDRWVLKSIGVTADGQTASDTSIYTFVNEHTMTWQSVDHEIAGVEIPDSEVVTIVRRAPPPSPADDSLTSKSP